MFRYYVVFFLFIFQQFFTVSPVIADSAADENISLQDSYAKAKFYFNQLETDPKLGSQRSLWLKSSRNFRQVYLANPKSELAPATLYMLGRIYLRMYERFQHKIDLKESKSYFKDCASLFPHHRLADDSLNALGEIYQHQENDFAKAAGYYSDVVARYPMGDMHPHASEQLKILSSKHDTEIPAFMLGDSNHNKLSSVLPVKYWSSENYTRIIIKASGPVTYSAQLLEKNQDKPRRLYIDFKNCYIEPRYRAPVPVANGLLKQIRTGQYSQSTVRVVLDIETIASYKIFSLPDPFRVVVDVRGVEPEIPPESTISPKKPHKPEVSKQQVIVLRDKKKRAVRKSASREEQETDSPDVADTPDISIIPELTLAQQLGLGVKKIVIDPGHGGKDPGAIANGLKEKEVVLRLAKKLQKKLRETLGCEVILTREDDTYLSLEERTAIANGNNADLFISLHINAHPLSTVQGFETYFLNLTTNREAMRVAAFENATSELQLSDLQDVLADIMKNSKIEESSRLARNVHNTVIEGLKTDGSALKDLGVKQAPFYVLIGAEMPSILIEIAFISNPKEAKMLREETFLQSMATRISKGIRLYIDANTAQLSP